MARYEVAVSTPVAFASLSDPTLLAVADQVAIQFDDRQFVWHNRRSSAAELHYPVITTVVADGNEYAAERLMTNRFLSALSFILDMPFSNVLSVFTGFRDEFDRPTIGQPGLAATRIEKAPVEIDIRRDDRLRLVLALYREGRSADSPFYRFLAFYNALDAAFDNDERARDEYVNAELHTDDPSPAEGWARYLRDSMRNAVAHAVRREGKSILDPDDLTDRSDLLSSANHVAALCRSRVSKRWPDGVIARY